MWLLDVSFRFVALCAWFFAFRFRLRTCLGLLVTWVMLAPVAPSRPPSQPPVTKAKEGAATRRQPGPKNLALNTQEPFRPKPNEFAPLDRAHAYRGELVFVDRANRRGSLRIDGAGRFRFAGPSPFALLPYAVVRYHGAPADLRDIPLGTLLHVWAFLPPDPRISAVPVLPVNNRTRKLGYAGTGTAPAENHVLLMEDEISYCWRTNQIWRLKEIVVANNQGSIVAARTPREASQRQRSAEYVTMTFDAATRIWRGRECLSVHDLIAEGTWPAGGQKIADGQAVQLGIVWKPTPSGVFTRFHISDIWLDEPAMLRAARTQAETHKTFMRSRWIPARVDRIEYGEFGSAKVTATLFGGMDESLYADFRKKRRVMVAPSENTLKHWASGTAGTVQMASKGPLIDVVRTQGNIPLGSSGIQIQMETDLVTEGIRPGRVVRVRPESWPNLEVPREEYLHDARDTLEDRFPSPDIFPLYR